MLIRGSDLYAKLSIWIFKLERILNLCKHLEHIYVVHDLFAATLISTTHQRKSPNLLMNFFSLIGIVFPILIRAADCSYRRGEVRQRMMALPRSCSICDCYLFTQLSNFQYWFFYETWSIKLREHLSNTSRNSEIMDKTLQRLQWILIQKAL